MNHITTSFIKNKNFELNHKNCFIISGGFKEIIIPKLKILIFHQIKSMLILLSMKITNFL